MRIHRLLRVLSAIHESSRDERTNRSLSSRSLLTGSSRYKYSRWVVPHPFHLSRSIMPLQSSSLSPPFGPSDDLFSLSYSPPPKQSLPKSISLSLLLLVAPSPLLHLVIFVLPRHFRGYNRLLRPTLRGRQSARGCCTSVFRATIEYAFHDAT